MATLTGTIFSEVLMMQTELSVITPRQIDYANQRPYKVVYLFHGLSDSHINWYSNTQLPLFSDEYRVVFVLPDVQRSFYTDMEYGMNYYTYVTEELPQICRHLFGLSDGREDNYVMGLSMGGYGALKCALSKPERYAGCGAFSSACDLEVALAPGFLLGPGEVQAICGSEMKIKSENDVFHLARICNQKAVKPRIYMTCGSNDPLLNMSLKFRDLMAGLDFDYTYEEWEGAHEWRFWNDSVQRALAHLIGKPE